MLEQVTFKERLKYCVKQVGTQMDFVKKTDVSRSQLSRYLDGASKPPIDRLVNIAETSGVDLTWLVTGTGTPCKPEKQHLSFNYELTGQVVKIFEETLMEYQGPKPTPTVKSILIPFIQAEMEHEIRINNNHALNSAEMHNILDYASAISSNNMLETYKNHSFEMLSSKADSYDDKKVGTFVNTVCNASHGYFSTATGANYCNRTQDILNGYALKSVYKIMETLFTTVRSDNIKMLDLGCGSGRYLQYIHKNYDRIKVHGIEPSRLPHSVCKEKEISGQLPEGSVARGDARNLPYKDNSFDFVLSKAVLHWIPHFKNSAQGANKAFSEVARILKPGGAFYFDMRHHKDSIREYLPFNQTYSKEDIQLLASKHGFKIEWIHSESTLPELQGELGDVHSKFGDFISVFAIKI